MDADAMSPVAATRAARYLFILQSSSAFISRRRFYPYGRRPSRFRRSCYGLWAMNQSGTKPRYRLVRFVALPRRESMSTATQSGADTSSSLSMPDVTGWNREFAVRDLHRPDARNFGFAHHQRAPSQRFPQVSRALRSHVGYTHAEPGAGALREGYSLRQTRGHHRGVGRGQLSSEVVLEGGKLGRA